jgi:glycosyltransferase involved in cell wall biosynthesis
MSVPLVSICIPTYNRGERLLCALDSAISQNYSNLEIIISDNSSSDETEKICNSLKLKYANIRYYRQETNIGPTANFQFVKLMANGKYFMWLSDDDWLDRDYIAKCVSHLEHKNELILVSGTGAYYRSPNKIEFFGNRIQLLCKYRIVRLIKYLWLVEENSIFYGVYRTQGVINCTFPNILGGDWAWICEVALSGKAAVLSDTYINRLFGDSSSATYDRLASSYGLSNWATKMPMLTIALGIARSLSHSKLEKSLLYYHFDKLIYAILAFLTILTKASITIFKETISKITFVRVLYRTIRAQFKKV